MTALAPYFLVLVMVQHGYAGGAITSVGEFYSRASCEAAATAVKKATDGRGRDDLVAICVQR